MKKLFSFFTAALFLCISINSYAQVASYTFSQSAGTYVPITGGTIVATATGSSGAASLDDIVYNLPNGTIPFTFTYDGVGYTGLNISTNGFITLGATAPGATDYSPISGTGTFAGSLAPFGGDNNALFNILGNTGEIRYQTVGSEFVIQYSNFRPFSTSTSTTLFWRWNFQIRLNSNGSIKYVYDANFVGAPTSGSRQVGVRGPNNTFATNVKNRLITTGTHTWATSANGTTNGSTCAFTTANIPVSGQTYTFTPPLPPSANDVGVSAAAFGTSNIQIISVGKGYDVKATVKNFGTATQNVIPVYYDVNGGAAVGPVNTVGPIATNGTEVVSFTGGNAFVPAVAGNNTIRIWTLLASEEHPVANDTLTVVVNAQQKISSFPHLQTFGNPVNWTIVNENVVGTTAIWGLGICVNAGGVVNDTAITANFYNASTLRREMLRSPEMDFTGLSNPVLDFYVAYRSYTGSELDRVEVLVSTDGGVTFNPATTPYNKTRNTTPSLSTLPNNATAFFPSAATQWRHETVSLANVANTANVVIGFRGTSAFGNRGWIDNFIVSNVDGFCTSTVTGPGSYSCNPLVNLNFTATPAPHFGGEADNSGISTKNITKSENTIGSIPSASGDIKVISSNLQNDNPNGGTAFVSQYTGNDPGQTVNTNTTATTQLGNIFTPGFVYHDYWFTATYDGNDSSGYATYNISIDLDGLVFTDPTDLYIVKRSDKTEAWTCLNTTYSGNVLTASGLTDFSDFAIAGNGALPIELSSFTSAISGRDVTLNWSTVSESNNSGFDIERSSVNGSWSKVGNVTGNGTTTSGHSYSFTERNLASGNYSYRLKQIDFNGNFEYFNLSNEVIIGVPTNFELSQN
ncbi:MAG: hypothetical protein JST15_11965, partial [Bacteroidetes bacterium]|nr:hypothetical protein [Bacteroidota bacterium]